MVCQLVESADGYELVARLNSQSELSDMLGADVAIDLTVPGVSQSVVDFATANGLRVLVGTSGWSEDRIGALAARIEGHDETGVVIIPNFSIGSVLASAFAAQAARFFDSVEIIEAHHAGKVDSPSGTAVRTAELIGRARAALGPVSAPHTDQRARGQQVASVPIHSVRMDGLLARQEVLLGGAGEMLTISHNTLSSASYERGILLALAATRSARGVTVGLDALLDLGATPGSDATAPSVAPPTIAAPESSEIGA